MTKQVWKFALNPGKTTLKIPTGGEVLSVQTQHNEPMMWVLVNPRQEKEERCFEIFGTGHDMEDGIGSDRKYIGTFQMDGGSLVFHVFENKGV